jgi:hypothetical protein
MKKLLWIPAGLLGLVVLAWFARGFLVRLIPIEHEGEVRRIADFHKGGFSSSGEKTHQLRQFAILFDGGFDCEASDTSFAVVREGDRVRIKGYHDVKGFPVMDPERWECDEAQLLEILE